MYAIIQRFFSFLFALKNSLSKITKISSRWMCAKFVEQYLLHYGMKSCSLL